MLEGTPLLNATATSQSLQNTTIIGSQKEYDAVQNDEDRINDNEEEGEIQQSIGYLGSLSLIVNNLTG